MSEDRNSLWLTLAALVVGGWMGYQMGFNEGLKDAPSYWTYKQDEAQAVDDRLARVLDAAQPDAQCQKIMDAVLIAVQETPLYDDGERTSPHD